jgi:hypothetical protein
MFDEKFYNLLDTYGFKKSPLSSQYCDDNGNSFVISDNELKAISLSSELKKIFLEYITEDVMDLRAFWFSWQMQSEKEQQDLPDVATQMIRDISEISNKYKK